MNDDPLFRIRRLYHAINTAIETELTRLPATIYSSKKSVIVIQDFSGGMTQEEMTNIASAEIALMAGLEDHLKKWAAHNQRSPDRVSWVFENSEDLRVLHDLNNREKHGGPPRHGKGRSGKAPELAHVRRVMQLQTGAKEGSWCALTMATDGSPIASGDGSAAAIITGDVIDSHGGSMGDLHRYIAAGLIDIERLFEDFGLHVR